jgi:uncharacterized protein YsxB (DUF464 family)
LPKSGSKRSPSRPERAAAGGPPLTVRFVADLDGRIAAVDADGHAGWAAAGNDIVCAAVSAILQTAWVGLTDHAGVEVHGERNPGRLAMHWSAAAAAREDVRAIVGAARLGIEAVAAQYPERVRLVLGTSSSNDGAR